MTPEHVEVACWAVALLLTGYLIQTIGAAQECQVCRVLGRPCDECRK